MVQQIIKDYEEVPLINQQLEKLGHNIGIAMEKKLQRRLIVRYGLILHNKILKLV